MYASKASVHSFTSAASSPGAGRGVPAARARRRATRSRAASGVYDASLERGDAREPARSKRSHPARATRLSSSEGSRPAEKMSTSALPRASAEAESREAADAASGNFLAVRFWRTEKRNLKRTDSPATRARAASRSAETPKSSATNSASDRAASTRRADRSAGAMGSCARYRAKRAASGGRSRESRSRKRASRSRRRFGRKRSCSEKPKFMPGG